MDAVLFLAVVAALALVLFWRIVLTVLVTAALATFLIGAAQVAHWVLTLR